MVPKRKRVVISLKKKIELLDKLEKGVPVAHLAQEYGVARQTISDFKRNKDNLRAYAAQLSSDQGVSDPKFGKRKTLKKGKYVDLEKAIIKWYRQEDSVGVNVRGLEIQDAARRLAAQMNVADFNASGGWLHRFRQRHCMFQKRAHGESASASLDDVDPFRTELNRLINEEGLLLSQVYNFDETGLFWRAMPQCTQVMGNLAKAKGRKLDKARFSVLCGANADGSHRMKPIVVGKSAKPRCLKDVMHRLPCIYYSSTKAWFTSFIFSDAFAKHIVPAIIKFQVEVLKIPEERVRALVLLDNAPAHPAKEKLVAHNGRIRAMFLPPNTTSVIQPMDQGVINAVKLIYRRLFLSEVLVVEETPEDEEEDTRGKRTLEKLRAYNLKQAIFNFCEAWKQVKVTTLANAWKRLLFDVEAPVSDFHGFEAEDFSHMLASGGEEASPQDVEDWLGMDEGDPGHQLLSEQEIVDSVLRGEEEDDDDDDDDDEEPTTFTIKLSQAREHLDELIHLVDVRSRDFSVTDYENLRCVRRKIIELQHARGRQTKISSFFRTPTPTPTPTPTTTPEPSTSGYTPAATTTATSSEPAFFGFSSPLPQPFRSESDSE